LPADNRIRFYDDQALAPPEKPSAGENLSVIRHRQANSISRDDPGCVGPCLMLFLMLKSLERLIDTLTSNFSGLWSRLVVLRALIKPGLDDLNFVVGQG
jgi:hypothetical protein